MKDKFILDACCGPRHMWVNKKHPNAIYIDKRQEKKGFHPFRKNTVVQPDILMDFRNMTFEDGSFRLVVFDPPHMTGTLPSSMRMHQVYGVLDKVNWRRDLRKGFEECWRVLVDYGVLIFKWNDTAITYTEILKILPQTPLFQHISGMNRTKTYWACFMKLPEEYNLQETLE